MELIFQRLTLKINIINLFYIFQIELHEIAFMLSKSTFSLHVLKFVYDFVHVLAMKIPMQITLLEALRLQIVLVKEI